MSETSEKELENAADLANLLELYYKQKHASKYFHPLDESEAFPLAAAVASHADNSQERDTYTLTEDERACADEVLALQTRIEGLYNDTSLNASISRNADHSDAFELSSSLAAPHWPECMAEKKSEQER